MIWKENYEKKDVNPHKFYDDYLNKYENKICTKNGKLSFMINTTKRKANAQQ